MTSRFAFYMCLLFVAISAGRVTELVPILGPLQLGNLSALLLIIAIFSTSAHRLSKLSDSTLSTPVFVLFALIGLSILFSVWRGASFNFITNALPIIVLVYVGLVKSLGSTEDLRKIVYVVMASAIAFMFEGFSADWSERVEVESHFFDQNELALFLCCMLPFMLAEALIVKKRWLQISLFLASAGAILMMILTQSRGGFLALAAVTLSMVLFRGFRLDTRPADFAIRLRRALLLVFVAAIMVAIAPEGAKDRLMSVTQVSTDYNVVSEKEGRLAIWGRGLNYLKTHPWGAGVASYPKIDLLEGGQFRAPHNSFVQIAVEIGVVGFLVYLTCFKRAFRSLRKVTDSLEREGDRLKGSMPAITVYAYSQALTLSLVAFGIAGFFLSYGYSVVLFMLFGMVANAERLGRQIANSRSDHTGQATYDDHP